MKRWLTTERATIVLGVTRRTLNNWHSKGLIQKKESDSKGRGKQTEWLVVIP